VSTHVENAADFHYAIAAGADEIAHLPFRTSTLIGVEDAKLAAKRGIVVITTTSLVNRLRYSEAELAQVLQAEGANLKLLYENRVRLAIGSDDVTDSSVKEIQQLQQFGVFDNLALLKDLLPRILEDERADERSDPEQGKRPPRRRDERLTLGGVVVPPPSTKLSEVRGRWNRRRTEPLQASVESSCAE